MRWRSNVRFSDTDIVGLCINTCVRWTLRPLPIRISLLGRRQVPCPSIFFLLHGAVCIPYFFWSTAAFPFACHLFTVHFCTDSVSALRSFICLADLVPEFIVDGVRVYPLNGRSRRRCLGGRSRAGVTWGRFGLGCGWRSLLCGLFVDGRYSWAVVIADWLNRFSVWVSKPCV